MLALEPMLQEYAAAVVKDGRLGRPGCHPGCRPGGPLQVAAVEKFRALARAGFEHIEELGAECDRPTAVSAATGAGAAAAVPARPNARAGPSPARPAVGVRLPPARPGAVPSVLLAGAPRKHSGDGVFALLDPHTAAATADPAQLLQSAPDNSFGGVGGFRVAAPLADRKDNVMTCADVFRECGNDEGLVGFFDVTKLPYVPGSTCAAYINRTGNGWGRNRWVGAVHWPCVNAMADIAYSVGMTEAMQRTSPVAARASANFHQLFAHTFILTMPDSPRRANIVVTVKQLKLKPNEVTLLEGFRPTDWGTAAFEARVEATFGARLASVVDFSVSTDTRPKHITKYPDAAELADLLVLHEKLLDGTVSRKAFEYAQLNGKLMEVLPGSGREVRFSVLLAEVTQNLGWAMVYAAIMRGGYANALILEDDACGSKWYQRDTGLLPMLRRVVPKAGAGGEEGWDLLKLGDCYRDVGGQLRHLPNTRTDSGNLLLEMSPESLESKCLHAFAVSARFAGIMRNASMAAPFSADIQILRELFARWPEYRGLVAQHPVLVQNYEIAASSSIDNRNEADEDRREYHRNQRAHFRNGKYGECSTQHTWNGMSDEMIAKEDARYFGRRA